MAEPVIVATARTPIGRAMKGTMVEARPDDMSSFIISDVISKVPAIEQNASQIEDIIWGTAQPAGEQGFNMARVSGILSGLDVPGVTVNRYCSSSLQTIRMAAHAIKADEGDCFIAGGVDCVSRFMSGTADGLPNTQNPRFTEAQERSVKRAEGANGAWEPPEGLPDVYLAMGQTAENVADYKSVSREKQDEFACLSQNRAEASLKRGFFEQEITPYTLPSGEVIAKDDSIREGVTQEALSELKPVFKPDGTVTAGNACPLNDGAAAVIVMSDTRAKELGIEPLAQIIASGVSSLNPEIMGLGPVEAVKQALDRAGMSIADIDLVEINEAFAAQVVPSAEELGIEWDKLNINGGAIALGHPFGMTGARIMTTLLNGLEDADGAIGLESMCVGGGQGMAMIVKRLS